MPKPRHKHVQIETFPVLDTRHEVNLAMIVNGTFWTPEELAENAKLRRVCTCCKCITCRIRILNRTKRPEVLELGHAIVFDLAPPFKSYALS